MMEDFQLDALGEALAAIGQQHDAKESEISDLRAQLSAAQAEIVRYEKADHSHFVLHEMLLEDNATLRKLLGDLARFDPYDQSIDFTRSLYAARGYLNPPKEPV